MRRFFLISVGVGFLCLLSIRLRADGQKTSAEESIERRQKVELMGFFLKDPGQAKMPGTTLSIQSLNQAVEYFQKNEYELARQAAEEAIKHDGANAFAYELLGDICNNQQDLKEAKAQYEIAYNLQPRPALKEKLQKLGTETQVDRKLSTYREEHFIIKYHNQGIEGFELRELLRETYREISQDFGFYFKNPLVVLLYDEEEFKNITNAPHWVGGLYDGKVRLPVKKFSFDDRELRALARHEVTHSFLAAMSAQRIPAWFNEGLAQVEEDKVKKVDLLVFNAAIKTNSLLPVDQLVSEDPASGNRDHLWASLFYQQTFHFTRYLVTRYGVFNIKKMLAEFASGKNSDEVIRAVLMVSPAKLEKEWHATFTN